MAFKKIRSVKMDEDKQMLVYSVCKNLSLMDDDVRRRVRSLCRAAGGEHHKALLQLLTGKKSAEQLAIEHYIDPSTLYRARKRFYDLFFTEINFKG